MTPVAHSSHPATPTACYPAILPSGIAFVLPTMYVYTFSSAAWTWRRPLRHHCFSLASSSSSHAPKVMISKMTVKTTNIHISDAKFKETGLFFAFIVRYPILRNCWVVLAVLFRIASQSGQYVLKQTTLADISKSARLSF